MSRSVTPAIADPVTRIWTELKQAGKPVGIGGLLRRGDGNLAELVAEIDHWKRLGICAQSGIAIALTESGRALAHPPHNPAARRHRRAVTGLCDPADLLWTELRLQSAPDDLAALLGRIDAPLSETLELITHWSRAGAVRQIGTSITITEEYQMSCEPPSRLSSDPQHGRSVRERLWATMRILKSFDVETLVIAAETRRESTVKFLTVMERAGYVRRREFGSGFSVAKVCGPKPPAISYPVTAGRQMTRVTDRNTQDIIEFPVRAGPKRKSTRRRASVSTTDGGVS